MIVGCLSNTRFGRGPAGATPQHHRHPVRRRRLRRRRLLRRDESQDAEHRPAGKARACASRTPTRRRPPARPARYALMTGEYAWRQAGTGVLPGDAPLIIEPGRLTMLAAVLKQAGYATGCRRQVAPRPGRRARSIGTARSSPARSRWASITGFIIPATGDRVPCVYIENHRVVGLDPNDPDPRQLRLPRSATSRPGTTIRNCSR